MRTVTRSAMWVTALAALTMFLSSCPPPRPMYVRGRPMHAPDRDKGRVEHVMLEAQVLKVVDPCQIVFEDGTVPTTEKPIKFESGQVVRWINEKEIPVVISFGDYSLFGDWSIRLNPGESHLTRVKSSWSTEGGIVYPIALKCLDKEIVDGPTPPIKEEPPPGGGS